MCYTSLRLVRYAFLFVFISCRILQEVNVSQTVMLKNNTWQKLQKVLKGGKKP